MSYLKMVIIHFLTSSSGYNEYLFKKNSYSNMEMNMHAQQFVLYLRFKDFNIFYPHPVIHLILVNNQHLLRVQLVSNCL